MPFSNLHIVAQCLGIHRVHSGGGASADAVKAAMVVPSPRLRAVACKLVLLACFRLASEIGLAVVDNIFVCVGTSHSVPL